MLCRRINRKVFFKVLAWFAPEIGNGQVMQILLCRPADANREVMGTQASI